MAFRDTKLRPTTGKVINALFSMIGATGIKDKTVLELYAGTGNFGIKAVKLGAKRVDFVEISKPLCTSIGKRIAELGFDNNNYSVRCGDSLRTLSKFSNPYDVVFADPPYTIYPFQKIVEKLEEVGLIYDDSVLFFEHSARYVMAEHLVNLVRVKLRRYGDSAISVYERKQTL